MILVAVAAPDQRRVWQEFEPRMDYEYLANCKAIKACPTYCGDKGFYHYRCHNMGSCGRRCQCSN